VDAVTSESVSLPEIKIQGIYREIQQKSFRGFLTTLNFPNDYSGFLCNSLFLKTGKLQILIIENVGKTQNISANFQENYESTIN